MANRLLIGKDGSNKYGLKVSTPGNNVITTTNLSFNTTITDSSSGIVSAGGRSFVVNSSGSIAAAVTTKRASFPSIVNSNGDYTTPLILLMTRLTQANGSFAAGRYWGYGFGTFAAGIGAYMDVYSHGFNSTGGNWTSGTQYGRVDFTCGAPTITDISYFIMSAPLENV